MTLSVKDAMELYENGKHRRYSLLFSVNGGAYAVAAVIAKSGNVLGGLSLRDLSMGMVAFTIVMTWDIYEFGERNRKVPIPEVFGNKGKMVLLLLGALICIGWIKAGFIS